MNLKENIAGLTIILAFSAGFCDAATFTAANELFSAHVTGNFIVFAFDLAKGANAESWLKLVSFPVFTAAVALSGWLAAKQLKSGYTLLLWESILLLIAAVLDVWCNKTGTGHNQLSITVPFIIILAMGIQNAFGRIYPKTVYGPTTIMTGNVTQITLDIVKVFLPEEPGKERTSGLGKQLLLIAGFLVGCIAGALLGSAFGLWTVALPGLLLLLLYIP